jgi:hypothetical protein
MFKSKTIWFAILLAVGGILEQSQSVITQLVGPQNTGLIMLVISIIVAVLRIVTTQPISAK